MKTQEPGCFILGVSGGSASGKTTLAKTFLSSCQRVSCELIYQDSYYFDLSQQFDFDGGSVNFDHPSSIDFDLLCEHLDQLKAGQPVHVPTYDFATHSRLEETRRVEPKSLILVDGILLLSQPKVRERLDASIYIDTKEEVRFERRLSRDVSERGRTPEGVRKQFYNQVKPMHDQFVEPSKQFADHVYVGEGPMKPVIDKLSRWLSLKGLDFV